MSTLTTLEFGYVLFESIWPLLAVAVMFVFCDKIKWLRVFLYASKATVSTYRAARTTVRTLRRTHNAELLFNQDTAVKTL